MLFIADAGGEEEGVPSASILAVAERQAPEPGDLDCLVVCVCEGAEEFPRVRIEGVDLAVAEVANQQVVAEFAKARRSHRQAPGRVELSVRDQATDQRARRVVDIHKSVAGAGEIIVFVRLLLGIADVKLAAQIVDVERGKTSRGLGIRERAGPMHPRRRSQCRRPYRRSPLPRCCPRPRMGWSNWPLYPRDSRA